MLNLLDLPFDLLAYIFQYVNKVDRKHLMLIHQRLRDAVWKSMVRYKHVYVKRINLSFLEQHKFPRLTFHTVVPESLLVSLFLQSHTLHTVNLSGCAHVSDAVVASLTPLLYELNISSCVKVTDVSVQNLTLLKVLDVSATTRITEKSLTLLTALHTLDITYCRQVKLASLTTLCNLHIINRSRIK